VRRLRLARIFWIGAAAILVAAALIAIAAIVRGDFSDTDGKICGTLAALLLCGALAVCGLALAERGAVRIFAWAAVGLAVLGFVLLVTSIWQEFDDSALARSAGSALVAIVGCLLVATSLLLLRSNRLASIVIGEAIAVGLASLLVISGIWGDDLSGGAAQADAVLWIVAVLCWLLIPVLQRVTMTRDTRLSERVLAELDGVELVATRSAIGVDVRLARGETLLLRRIP